MGYKHYFLIVFNKTDFLFLYLATLLLLHNLCINEHTCVKHVI